MKPPSRKQCIACKSTFIPNPRTKDKQRYCSKHKCQTIRQRQNELNWRKSNPDCMAYQQEQSRQWHKARPHYSHQRRKDCPVIETKNRNATRLRMRQMRQQRMFDKSKSILKQLIGGYALKCYISHKSRWLMLRLTKASPLSRLALIRDNPNKLRRLISNWPKAKLYDLSGLF